MAIVTTRTELEEYCLRKLGAPVIDINVADEQIDDRIDEALEVYQEYHSDATVNSLKDMDTWLAQVASCDGVVSVANTTIHGSGGLNIPTFCLLSLHSDWRWLKNESVLRSYWYPSVGIARESEDRGWTDAIANVKSWILAGLPYPSGAVSI